ncbi:ankyrin repeat-containing domain protein [Dactylonectria macrodidyma]|uniref:Ankyrin repeat-containing domain protein n=1 Tax=Dactylonectria macrodidyma TaxID=307937 RepID=A0A9P9DUK8_9HYPO|nr:ankyrin repeat-containing domain protein [Dactylonectria macrodidyma]
MGDPLSVISGVAGIIAIGVTTTQGLLTLIQQIKDAPEDIHELQLELGGHSSVLQSAKQLCATYGIRIDDAALVETVSGCVQHSSAIIGTLQTTLKPFIDDSSWRRRSIRAIGWTMRKGEIRAQRSRFRDGTASLTLAVAVLNGYGFLLILQDSKVWHLTGKGHNEIRNDIATSYEKLSAQFQSLEKGKILRKKLESDLESVTFVHRRDSKSAITDLDLPIRRYLEQQEPDQFEEEQVKSISRSSGSPPPPEEPLLIQAAKAGNRRLIQELLARGTSTLDRGTDGRTALHYSAIHDDSETALQLIEHGADINAKDNALDTPFKLATSGESINVRVAVCLIEKGCAMGSFPAHFVDVLATAEEPGNLRPLIYPILTRWNKSAAQNPFLLHQAISLRQDACLKILLEEGVDPKQRDSRGIPAVMHATLHRRISAIRILVDHGADIDAYMPRWQPGHVVMDQDYLKGLPDRSGFGENSLSLAVYWVDLELVQDLLQVGTNPDFVFPDLDQSTDLEPLSDAQGQNLIHRNCAGHLFDLAKILIDAGTDINRQVRSTGETPLFWCIVCGNMPLLHLLIEKGVNVNVFTAPKEGGMSALHSTVQYGKLEMARVLIANGADLRAKNNSGETPQEQARNSGKDEFIRLFEETEIGNKG